MIAILGTTTYLHSPLKLRLKAKTTLNDQPVRVKRSQTLDGGAVLVNTGFTTADKNLTLVCDMTQAEHETLLDLLANETLFTLSCAAGFFTGAISNVSQSNGITIAFLVCDDTLAAVPVVTSSDVDLNTDYVSVAFGSGGWTTGDGVYSDYSNSGGSSDNYIYLGYSTRGPYTSGIRFTNSNIPAEAVGTAHIQFTGTDETHATDFEVEISCQASDDAEYPTVAELLTVDQVPQRTTWEITEDWVEDDMITTPDFADTINQVLTRAGYEPGNGILILFNSKYKDTSTSQSRTAQDNPTIRLVLNGDL